MEGRRKEGRGRDLPDLCETASYAPALTLLSGAWRVYIDRGGPHPQLKRAGLRSRNFLEPYICPIVLSTATMATKFTIRTNPEDRQVLWSTTLQPTRSSADADKPAPRV